MKKFYAMLMLLTLVAFTVGCPAPEEASDGDNAADTAQPEGDAAEGDAAEGDAAEGDAAEGDAAEGDAAEGDAAEGDAAGS